MWTNVFKIGGLHQVSWFQFLPSESDLNPPPDTSVKVDQRDAAALLVLSSHLQLQKEGFLSTWTNSFVGPWDPSQGIHNPDEKIKLWLFIPGRHSSVVEKAKAAVCRLRVLASGLWLAPGDSEEVAAALSQALRNCIERALRGLSYMRFGDVFSRYNPSSQGEELYRRGQPVVEFIFAASEEAIFVHVVISAKHTRALSNGDMEGMLKCSSSSGNRLPVIVSPHGMRGRLTGFCPGDLVKQVYSRASNGIVGLPYQVSQSSGCQLRGQNFYLEVTLGCDSSENDKTPRTNSKSTKNLVKQQISDSSVITREGGKGLTDQSLIYERTFIYPAEAVLVPVVQTSSARSSLKRFWLQNWMGPSLSGLSFLMHCDNVSKIDSFKGSWLESSGIRTQHGYNSSGNSNSSSISSISTSSDSDYKMIREADDLEADADSLACGQSGLSSTDGSKLGKRSRTGMIESFNQAGAVVNNSTMTGVENDQVGSDWDWDDDDRGTGLDIQALLSEFGDFGDFFENDSLPFGELPGMEERQALMFSPADCGDVGSSLFTGMMDASDQMLLPVGFSSFESFNPPPAVMEEAQNKSQEVIKDDLSSGSMNYTSASLTAEFEYLIKSEALMTFAPEYGAVETYTNGLSSSVFRSPYIPQSRKVETENSSTNSYIYSATPPSSCLDGSEEKLGVGVSFKARSGKHEKSAILHSKNYYTHVESVKEKYDRGSLTCDKSILSREDVKPSAFSGFSSANSTLKTQIMTIEGATLGENFVLSAKTAIASEVECMMFQAFMCKIRHTLLSFGVSMPVGVGRLSGNTVLYQMHGKSNIMTENISSKYDLKKKEDIPVRIAGNMDGGILDGPLSSPVGVWRSVGGPKGSKPMTPSMEAFPSLTQNSFNEDGMLSYVQRQPLLELLNGMALLVQQATSLVDVTLDADCGDGPYGWLALQEQWRRGFSCGPSMVHAGCGGALASCHSLDVAGVDLVDPLSADVHASYAISLLQSDIKAALKSAFGNCDGPLSVTDWCKGRSGQSGDTGGMMIGDGFSAESSAVSMSECTANLSVGEPISPCQSSAGGSSSCLNKVSSSTDGTRADEASERRSIQENSTSDSEQQLGLLRPTVIVLPFPAILVGYQDDWLKTSASSLQHWEKAPFEPYAVQKHVSFPSVMVNGHPLYGFLHNYRIDIKFTMTYHVVCPDIDPLTTAAADFFQQLGTVYETCKLGTHSPQCVGNQMVIDSGKWSSSGFVLLDCPQSMKIDSSSASLVGSISDYFLSLSNGWDLTSFLKSLSKVLKSLKLGSCFTPNPKEGNSGPCTVIYVVCPFPEPVAVLKTIIESCAAVGSVIFPSSDKERRSVMLNQVGKALSCTTTVDEASISNVVTLPGFSVPKLVLQVVTVDAIFRVTSPSLNELVILKEIAFTVFNKARRNSRGSSSDLVPSLSISSRSHSTLMPMNSPISGMWKDSMGPRMTGTPLQREGELDASLRAGTWDNSWQVSRTAGLGSDSNRTGGFLLQDELRYMFEPLFILAEPGSPERGVSPPLSGSLAHDSSKLLSDDGTSRDNGPNSQADGSEADGFGSSHQKTPPSLHCCYGWTEDWRWLVCIWTDSRGELLDSYTFPFGGISSRQDTKGLQFLFAQILQQGCQILQSYSPDTGIARPRDFVITRIGCFFELECQEWQKALYSVGGSEVKKWTLQLRRSVPDGMPASSNGTSLQQQEMSPHLSSSPSPYAKASGFMKGGLGQPSARKQILGGHGAVDSSRGLLHLVQSITFVSVSVDHSLQLVFQADLSPGATQSSSITGQSAYLEGFTAVKSLGCASASYMFIPSPSMRFLPPSPLQLPTCLTSESPPLAHLLHSKGSAIPLSTGFVVSKAVPCMRKESRKEEWPSVLSVNLVDYYGGSFNISHEKMVKNVPKAGGRVSGVEARDFEIEMHLILERVAAELHALSWMTISPAYLERRSSLPFHCDMVMRLGRLLHFADKELSRLPDKPEL